MPISCPVSLAFFAKVAPQAINATLIGLYYLALFLANTLVGLVGGFYQTMPTTTFWLPRRLRRRLGPLLRGLQVCGEAITWIETAKREQRNAPWLGLRPRYVFS